MSAFRSSGPLRWVSLILLGGCLGTAARAGLETHFPPTLAAFPWTTLIINLVGSFGLGLLLEALSLTGPDQGARRGVRLTLGTGILGGFTTYSTFMVETAERLREGHALLAIAYLVGSVMLGLLAAASGIALASRLHFPKRAGEAN